MRLQSRLFRLSWLLPAALLQSAGAEAGAQEAPSHMNMDAHAQAADIVRSEVEVSRFILPPVIGTWKNQRLAKVVRQR